MIEPYWWYPYLFFGVAGEFPWAFQRLCGSDLDRYIEIHHEEDSDFLRARLEIFRNCHSVDSYVAAGDRHNLDLMGIRRFLQSTPQGPFRAKLSPQYMNRFADAKMADVVADIREFRPDVQMIDLMTSYVALVFRKHTRSNGSLALTLQRGER